MKDKGFTLIELLAVIVILAIIALIAVPIILNIIDDSKNSSDKRSIELYAKAVENAIGNYQIKNPEDSEITLEKIQEYIEYKGNKVECDTTNINKDGTVYLSGCKINDKEVEYTYGKEITTPDLPSVPTPVSFEEDDWSTIVANVQAGNISAYNVGATKEVDLGELGVHTLRIANTTAPEECNTEGFSQTACGFVIEFADVITTHSMNLTATNVGGWEDSEMRTYVNDTIYNSLSSEIKNNIIDTYVVSGHGSTSGETNFETIDKLYLLSTKELWGKEGTSNTINYDTAETETRQLDYYKSIEVTTANYSGTIKSYNGSVQRWWLRSANSNMTNTFYYVSTTGDWNCHGANTTNGVAPAFRIG